MKYFLLPILFVLGSCSSKTQMNAKNSKEHVLPAGMEKVVKTDAEWKAQLNDEEYYVIRDKGTERPFTGAYWDHKASGVYTCRACNLPLFASDTKYKSGTGWPSYYEPVEDAHIKEDTDHLLGYARTEVMCARCDGHLGHVFTDGPKPTGLRYCINSLSLSFEEKKVDP